MALKISLVAATGMILLEKTATPEIRRPSQGLFYQLLNSTVTIYERNGNFLLTSEASNNIQDIGGATLASDAAVRAYLDTIIGVQKTV